MWTTFLKVTHLLMEDFRLVPRIIISIKYGTNIQLRIPVAGSRFHQMLVGADVSEIKRRNACPVCVWGTPKPIKGQHYFRGRERNVETQRKEENDHEQRFLKEAVN